MKLNKEYPATHSMATAWYCVDEDGNVGVFDIDDNGPIPVGEYKDTIVDNVFWDDFSADDKEFGFRVLNLTDEQIEQLLSKPNEERGEWKNSYGSLFNGAWMDAIIQIDMSKLVLFRQCIDNNDHSYGTPVCISKKRGLFFVDFSTNRFAVDALEQNNVVLAKYFSPHYYAPDSIEDANENFLGNENFPFFIFYQDYSVNAAPAIKLTSPTHPLKIEQLPSNIKGNIKLLPLKFNNTQKIQLAELMPVEGIWSVRYVFQNRIWWELASSNDSMIYYNVSTNTILPKEEMDKYIECGDAEKWDYYTHKDIKD